MSGGFVVIGLIVSPVTLLLRVSIKSYGFRAGCIAMKDLDILRGGFSLTEKPTKSEKVITNSLSHLFMTDRKV